MIWQNYVFRRGVEAEDLWDHLFADRREKNRPLQLLYIAGRGFDVRANSVLERFVDRLTASKCEVAEAKLLLVGLAGYQMSPELHALTARNAELIEKTFARIGETQAISVGGSIEGEDDVSATVALRRGADEVLKLVHGQTDIVLDVSALPRIAYLTILLSLLARLAPHKDSLITLGTTLHVLVGEDPVLDSEISSEDPSNDLVLIPGYSEAMQSEALRDVPLVWFPIVGENRLAQVQKVEDAIPSEAEICPVLPHPSHNPRRGDQLLAEYATILFTKRETPFSNILYVDERHPFEVYRQLLGAMHRYRTTLQVIGGCRLIVTPLASKLITIGAALACFEMKVLSASHTSNVAIPYAEPKRYVASVKTLLASHPEVSALILTGDPYLLDPAVAT